jgi:hypothetical protein
MTILPYPDSDPAQQLFQQLGSPLDSTSQYTQTLGGLQEVLRRINVLRSSSFPGSMSGGSSYPTGSPNYTPGYPAGPSGSPSSSSPTDASALLRLYGVSQPDIRQSPFLSNNFMEAHPALGGALNNALAAAALTPDAQGPEGVGGGISRSLRGVMGVQPYMRQFQMQQSEAPLQYADALAKLYGSTAQADMYRAHADYFRQMPGERLESAQLRYLAQQNKLGQPVHDSTGKLLGYMGADGFQSAGALGIPDEASVNKSFDSKPRYNIEAYTQSVIADQMTKRFGSDQSKWPSQVPQDIWQAGISEAQKQFKVLPQDAINSNRQGDIESRWRATTQLSIQRMLEGEQGRINSRYDRITNDPMIKWNDANRLNAEAQRKQELQDAQDRAQKLQDTLLGPQNSQQTPSKRSPKSKPSANAANAIPQRPANVPDDYEFDAQGPKGAGWYKPQGQ